MAHFSDHIVFVDESGDHGLDRIDANYPIFVLAFCIFRKSDYIEQVVPAFQRFKLRHFGHEQVVLHERDIRKDLKDFRFLKSPLAKRAFLEELTCVVRDAEFRLVCTVIDKQQLKTKYADPRNPYHVALGYGLERVHAYLEACGQRGTTHVVVESRGHREDRELAGEFATICNGANYHRKRLPFQLVFAKKHANASGLQLADLVARPVGMQVLRPEQPNRAFDTLAPKFHASPTGQRQGWGLKVFP